MLARTLQRLVDEKLTTAREIADLAGVSASTVYRWIAGQSQPDFDSIRLLVRHLPEPRAQRAILSTFSAGTPWRYQYIDHELDVNDDGQIDVNDALDSSIRAVQSAGEMLAKVRDASQDRRLSAEQVGVVIKALNEVVQECSVTQQVMVRVWEGEQNQRKRARRGDGA